MTAPPQVVVVGGGLAGIAAALGCVDGGAQVTLIDRRRHLGGLTWSFPHQGRWIDNGQHVFLRCCTAYLAFLTRIGSAGDVELQRRLDLTVIRPLATGEACSARLRRDHLPAPLHLGRSLLRYGHLSLADRCRLGRAALALRRLDLDDPALDCETFAGWLERHGQRSSAVEALWDLIILPTVNLPSAEASLAMGAKVFQTGLLTDAGAADVGWSRIPLGRLHGERAGDALARAGVAVGLAERAISIDAAPAGASGPLQVHTVSRSLEADTVVVALPHQAVAEVLPAASFATQASLDRLGLSPIVDVHVVFDRPVTDLALAAGIDSPVQWVFDRTASSGLADSSWAHSGSADSSRRPQYLAVSLSGADQALGRRPDDIGRETVTALRRLFPAARRAEVIDTLVTKERTATFRAAPGAEALRPGPRTRLPGLLLAGAWTDTGWPATMEGAVRSGQAAARCALIDAGLTRRLPEEAA